LGSVFYEGEVKDLNISMQAPEGVNNLQSNWVGNHKQTSVLPGTQPRVYFQVETGS